MTFRRAYGHTHSENGWRMCDHNETVTVKVVPGSVGAPLRSGDVATILNAWIIEYDRTVERVSSQVWGWSRDNDVPNSNHLSGTAIDINAPKYPWGRRVMPADRIRKVRAALARFDGVVFWGADWSRADEMHYQIGFREGDQRVAALARKLRDGHLGIYGPGAPVAAAPVPSDSGMLRNGSAGDRVRDLQRHLNTVFPAYSSLNVDGMFGPATDAVVREAQRRSGLAADGIVGPDTQRVILWNG